MRALFSPPERPPLSVSAGIPRSAVNAIGVALTAFWIVGLCVLCGKMARRYPLACSLAIALIVATLYGGFWGPINLVLIVGILGLLWSALHRVSFEKVLGRRLRAEGRRFTVYGWNWRSTFVHSGLARHERGRVLIPKLKSIRSDAWRDELDIGIIAGQDPADYAAKTPNLAHAWGAYSVRVRVPAPGRLAIDVIHKELLIEPVTPPALPDISGLPDLTAVPLGITETGDTWTEPLYETHWLFGGATGSGKSEMLEAALWALAPGIQSGLVEIYGIDPKGGMEFGRISDVFTELVTDNDVGAVELIEHVRDLTFRHSKQLAAGKRGRRWTRDCGVPIKVLMIDELADVLAYQPDRRLRERANLAMQKIGTQGRGPGTIAIGALQDPRKEILAFRHLFPTRVALRLEEPTQVDMVLGDGACARGAAAHEIPRSLPGVAWVKVDGRSEARRVRGFHITDAHLDLLNDYVVSGRSGNGWFTKGTEAGS